MQTISRPMRKWCKRRYFVGILLLICVATPFAFYYITSSWRDRELQSIYLEMDAEDPNWRWNDLLAERKVPASEVNSALQVLKISALLKAKPFTPGPKWDNEEQGRIRQFCNAQMTDEQLNLLQTAFGKLDASTLDEARKLKDMPEGRIAVKAVENPMAITFEDLHDTRGVVNLLQCDALMRAQDQDVEGAAQSCRALVNACHSVGDHPTMIGQLVRMSLMATSFDAIQRVIGQGEITEENLKKLQEILEKDAADNFLYCGIRGERAFGHQIYILMRDGKISMSQLTGNIGAKASMEDRLIDAMPFLVLRDYPAHLRLLNEQVFAAKLQDSERMSAIERLEDKVRKYAATGFAGNKMYRILGSIVHKIAEQDQRIRAHQRCVITAIASERFRLKHQRWPAALEELVKEELLKDVPVDPYDGKPIRWRRTNTGLVFYSIGKDKIDNGGKLDRANPQSQSANLGFELWDTDRRYAAPPAVQEVPAKNR